MKELVELLKQARQEKQISLEEVSSQTKIQRRYLEAMERGDFSLFAGEVYARGAICNYAEIVGLDPREVMALYHRLKGETAPAEAIPVEPEKTEPRPRSYGPERQGPSLTAGVVVLVLLLIAGSIWFASRYFDQSAPGEPGRTGDPARDEPGEAQPEPTIPGEAEVMMELTVIDSTSEETSYGVTAAEEIDLKVILLEPCWIQLVIDGKDQFYPRTFLPGEELSVTAGQRAWIRMGNPAGVTLTIGEIEISEVKQYLRPHNFSFTLE